MDRASYVYRAVCMFCEHYGSSEHGAWCERGGGMGPSVLRHGWCKHWKKGSWGSAPTETDVQYLAEITNGVEFGTDFLAVCDTLEDAKALIEKHNIDIGVVTEIRKNKAYPDRVLQYWKYKNGEWEECDDSKYIEEDDDAETDG
jgi:hypothetical protein